MNIEDCVSKGMLRKANVGKEETTAQLRIAEDYVRKAEIILGKETYDISFLTAYISIFHSARALLYIKGYKERSHFCLFEFVSSEFKANAQISRLAEIAQSYRETRHLIQYEGSLCSEASAREAIKDAKDFLKAAQAVIV